MAGAAGLAALCLTACKPAEPKETIKLSYSVFFPPTHVQCLSLIHISEPTSPLSLSYAVFCLKKKNR